MALTAEQKTNIITKYGANPKDTGSSESQIALFTENILILSEHMKKNKKDAHNKRGLLRYISKRKKLLRYLKDTDFDRYKSIVTQLGLRK